MVKRFANCSYVAIFFTHIPPRCSLDCGLSGGLGDGSELGPDGTELGFGGGSESEPDETESELDPDSGDRCDLNQCTFES